MCAYSKGARYRDYGYVPLRFGGGGGVTSLGEWEHGESVSFSLCPSSTGEVVEGVLQGKEFATLGPNSSL